MAWRAGCCFNGRASIYCQSDAIAYLHRFHGLAAMRVLVIDDNEDTAFLLSELTKACGHPSRFCTLPDCAIETVHDWQPELILLDLAMPGTNGYELAPKLRAASNGFAVQIVLVSGYLPDITRLAEAMIDGHVLKPVSLGRLRQLLP